MQLLNAFKHALKSHSASDLEMSWNFGMKLADYKAMMKGDPGTVLTDHQQLMMLKFLFKDQLKFNPQTRKRMEKTQILTVLMDHLDDVLSVPEKITPESHLKDDLGMDSLQRVEMCMTMEKELNVDVPDDEFDGWATVQDVADSLFKKYRDKHAS
jgi:acyl carrier protein